MVQANPTQPESASAAHAHPADPGGAGGHKITLSWPWRLAWPKIGAPARRRRRACTADARAVEDPVDARGYKYTTVVYTVLCRRLYLRVGTRYMYRTCRTPGTQVCATTSS